MALPKLNSFTFNHADQQDKVYLTYTAAQLKQKFDSRGEEARVALNNLIDALAATTQGNSGAGNVGATSITGLNGNNIQAILESMKLQLDNATTGAIPDGSLEMQKFKNYKRVVDSTTKDAKGIYTTVRFRRTVDDTLAVEMALSIPDANGFYTKDTWKFYDAAGTTVLSTVTWTYTYDADGNPLTTTPA